MSNTAIITIQLDLMPEAVARFCAELPEKLKDTRKFPGCRNVRVLKHKSDPNKLMFIEEWATEEDYNRYIAWRTERGEMDNSAVGFASPPKMDIWPTLIA